MITALVLVSSGPVEALGATLGALVGGVAEGLIADAVVLVPKADREVEVVVEAIGASLVQIPPGDDPWRTGAARARRDWLFCLEAGDVPEDGWIRAIERFTGAPAGPRLGRIERRPEAGGVRPVLWFEALVGALRPRPGDIVHKGLLARFPFEPRLRPVRVSAFIARGPGLI